MHEYTSPDSPLVTYIEKTAQSSFHPLSNNCNVPGNYSSFMSNTVKPHVEATASIVTSPVRLKVEARLISQLGLYARFYGTRKTTYLWTKETPEETPMIKIFEMFHCYGPTVIIPISL